MASKSPHSAPQNAQERRRLLATDELIGRLYASHQHGVAPMVEDLPASERADLAMFCYQRAHLRDIGLAIAATCDRWSLVNAAGRAGDALFASSRNHPVLERAVPITRRRVTLASLVPSSMPLDDDIEADVEEVPFDA